MPLVFESSVLPTKPFAVDFLPWEIRIQSVPHPFWCNATSQPTWASVSTSVNEKNNRTYLIRLLWGLNEFIHVKPLEQGLAHSKGGALAVVVIIILIIIMFGFLCQLSFYSQSQADLHLFLLFPFCILECEHSIREPLRTASLGGTAAGEKGWVGCHQERCRLLPGLSHQYFVYLPKLWIFLSIHRLSFFCQHLITKIFKPTVILTCPSPSFYNC